MVAPPGLRVVPAPPGDVATVIKAAREEAKAQGRELVVYVGATWCEPCRYFHKAAAAGELDAAFPDLTVLEFDLDERREPLVAAGYVGELVPLFALPGPDGRASGQKLEGSVKGAGAVANITPRLKKLLGR
ncbi:MAG: hypothetical protein JWP97_6774 [Labilithrix sp.]|nr:hypothetical protein [Labilithrix sp.]